MRITPNQYNATNRKTLAPMFGGSIDPNNLGKKNGPIMEPFYSTA